MPITEDSFEAATGAAVVPPGAAATDGPRIPRAGASRGRAGAVALLFALVGCDGPIVVGAVDGGPEAAPLEDGGAAPDAGPGDTLRDSSAGDAECEPGANECGGDAGVRYCNASGTWVGLASCPAGMPVCETAGCIMPGTDPLVRCALDRVWETSDLSWEYPGPQPSTLRQVSGSGPADVWAVGPDTTLHWDGSVWTIASARGGLGVWARAPNDVWVVGAGGTVRRWNGASWLTLDAPTTVDLRGAGGSGPDDVWIVGGGDTNIDNGAVVLHWDGTQLLEWPVFASTLRSVWASGPKDVWAVGTGSIVHFDGLAWAPVASPTNGDLVQVAGSAPDNVWAVATGWDPIGWSGQVLRLENGMWWEVPLPDLSADAVPNIALSGIFVRSPDDVWVTAGHTEFEVGAPSACGGGLLQFDGSAWRVHHAGCAVTGAWGAAADDLWAVTAYGGLLHWDGRAIWGADRQDSLDPNSGGAQMQARVTALGGSGVGDVWAAIDNFSENWSSKHWDGTRWESTSVNGRMFDMVALASDNVWFACGCAAQLQGTSWSCNYPPSSPPTDAGSPFVTSVTTVASPAPGELWAVADELWPDGTTSGRVFRWDGSALASLPGGVAASALTGVAGAAATDIWVVGPGVALRWDGTEFAPGPAPPVGVARVRVWAAATDDVWAVGDDGRVARWNGTAWASVSVAVPRLRALYAIWGAHAADVWAVGAGVPEGEGGPGLVLHFDGSSWSEWPVVVPASSQSAGALRAVWGTPGHVWFGGDAALLHLRR